MKIVNLYTKNPRSLGAAAKFPGSGGAILGLARNGMATLPELRAAFEAEGFVFVDIACEPYARREAYGGRAAGGGGGQGSSLASGGASFIGEGTEVVSVSLISE